MTNWTKKSPIQSDLWAWLDEINNIMTDENDDIIIFHTGDFYNKDTEWTKT